MNIQISYSFVSYLLSTECRRDNFSMINEKI